MLLKTCRSTLQTGLFVVSNGTNNFSLPSGSRSGVFQLPFWSTVLDHAECLQIAVRFTFTGRFFAYRFSLFPNLNSRYAKTNLQWLWHPFLERENAGPNTSLEFLGILLDTNAMQASLPNDKLSRIRSVMEDFILLRVVSKREMLSLIGHLNFAMSIIPQGRPFISRLLTLAYNVPNLSDLIRLDESQFLDSAANWLERHIFFLQWCIRIVSGIATLHRCRPLRRLRGILSGPLVCWKMAERISQTWVIYRFVSPLRDLSLWP